jgi:L-amino acid N-acyltransferase YncA
MPASGTGMRIETMTDAHAGFRVVGTRERIGQHHGRWRDTVLIERRSPVL